MDKLFSVFTTVLVNVKCIKHDPVVYNMNYVSTIIKCITLLYRFSLFDILVNICVKVINLLTFRSEAIFTAVRSQHMKLNYPHVCYYTTY